MLEPIFDADFEDGAYGYRPRRSAINAVKETHRLLCRGYTDVVDADLSKYFHTIPHADLLRSVARRVVDRTALRLIKLWLQVPVEERDGDGKPHMSGGKSNTRATPQDGVASPLLFVIYMNRFLKHWRLTGRGEVFRAHVISYAEGFGAGAVDALPVRRVERRHRAEHPLPDAILVLLTEPIADCACPAEHPGTVTPAAAELQDMKDGASYLPIASRLHTTPIHRDEWLDHRLLIVAERKLV